MKTLLTRAPADSSAEFFEALAAPGRTPGEGRSRDLYDGLIGSWDGEVVDHLPDGTDRRQSAELHFTWVLEGRAIQDLWIVPARKDRAPEGAKPAAGNRYGTTLRVYCPDLDAWRITWLNPVTGVETRLVARRVGSQVVQTGADADGRLLRWIFEEIGRDAFHWRGEISEDGGAHWTCDTEFFAHRHGAGFESSSVARSERRAVWEWRDRPGMEAITVESSGAGTLAESRGIVLFDGAPVSIHYRIAHDANGRFQSAQVEAGPPDAPRRLDLRRLSDGQWAVDGALRPDLEGCEDMDLMATPYTNSPPLAARPLAPGERRALRVAWVRFPDLDIRPVEQEYTRLDNGSGGTRCYRYRNLESGFTGELTLDGDGLVREYGPWVRR